LSPERVTFWVLTANMLVMMAVALAVWGLAG